jgi:hypothetical protein
VWRKEILANRAGSILGPVPTSAGYPKQFHNSTEKNANLSSNLKDDCGSAATMLSRLCGNQVRQNVPSFVPQRFGFHMSFYTGTHVVLGLRVQPTYSISIILTLSCRRQYGNPSPRKIPSVSITANT